jgi:(4S)-4-hydroxy-5-phosphonooxypentane-2,3-dione isomerase
MRHQISDRGDNVTGSGEKPMAVTYVINFHIQPERRDEFLQLLQSVLDAMRSEPMLREAVLHRDPASEDRFMLYETWESHEDVLNVQLHRPYRRAWHEALPHLLARDRDIAIWEPMRSDRAAL